MTAWSWPPGSVHRLWDTCKGGDAGCPAVKDGALAEDRGEGWVGH